MNYPAYTHVVKGGFVGPKVAIIGSIHGDERIGAEALEALKDVFSDVKVYGEISLILGNPKAYEFGKRFLDQDMNRLWNKDVCDLLKVDDAQLDSAQKRVKEILPILQNADYLLDIHSTIKPSCPFVYCKETPEHLNLACLLRTEYIVSSSLKVDDLISSSDNFVDKNGGIGLAYEAGWQKDETKLEDVLLNIKIFLQALGSCDFDIFVEEFPTYSHLSIYEQIVIKTNDFKFLKDYSNFDFVKEGEVIAVDEDEIVVEKDSYMIFPKVDLQKGNVACYLSYKK